MASSDGVESNDAIDPAFLLVNGRLWLSDGTYFSTIRNDLSEHRKGHLR